MNTKSENNANKHAGGLIMMRWQQTYARNLSQFGIYKAVATEPHVDLHVWNFIQPPPVTWQ